MKYQHVCIESFGHTPAEEIVSSEQLEDWLEPLYRRLRLQPGRLELMTGIRERRFWPRGTLPSEKSIASAERAIGAAGIDRGEIGASSMLRSAAIISSLPRLAQSIIGWAWATTA